MLSPTALAWHVTLLNLVCSILAFVMGYLWAKEEGRDPPEADQDPSTTDTR